tara:strand:+ start:131 stop:595 length:465 start_codon:yes stop_codon:yes gene_type:complete
MAKKIHRTARGQAIDMESLRLQNENTIAVGNMKVNARGDELGFGGKVVKTRKEVVDETYKVHTMIPQDDKVYTDIVDQKVQNTAAPTSEAETVQGLQSPPPATEKFTAPKEAVKEEPKVMRGGLAAALAKKVEVEEPEIKPTGINSGDTGVKRI